MDLSPWKRIVWGPTLTGIFLFFIFSPLSSQEFQSGAEIDFGARRDLDHFISAADLRNWAQGRNLRVVPDCPYRDLQDFEAEVIPPEGFTFQLEVTATRRHYLYLDLVNFRPLHYPTARDCRPEGHSALIVHEKGFDLPAVHWLQVYIGGKDAGLVYLGNGIFPAGPLVFTVDREQIRRGMVEVRLIPSDRNGIFAIWDGFVSQYPPAEVFQP